MIDINELQKQVDLLDKQIISLKGIKTQIQTMIALEKLKTYDKYIPIVEKYLNKDLDKDIQNKLWEELNRNKIYDVIKHLECFQMEYKNVKDDNWKHIIITKKENEKNV